VKMSWSSSI